jgi:hypothetical protein
LTEWNDVVSTHERKGTLCLNGFHRYVPCLCVGSELLVPDVTCVVVVDHLKRPCRIGFQSEDVDGEGIAINDDPLTFCQKSPDWVRRLRSCSTSSFCITTTSMPLGLNPSSGWLDGPFECPRQQLIDPALPVAIHDCRECTGQVGQRIDRIELTGLDE